MLINWLNDEDPRPTQEPLMALVAIDGSHAIASLLDEGFEHNVLLRNVKGTDRDLDKYFRIIFNEDGADWTFVCPPNYRGITNKEHRIKKFYDDGYENIKEFLKEVGYPEEVGIPRRYRRHLDYLTNDDFGF